ncbi:GGDEF domain-containing protein [Aeromonas simiae]|uniref:GGDEF domain-containing protein n=1 Tax=Aeromonas simiae TaxID=218936 RepID=UPI00266C7FD1|nr:GGDEF domain-containing protein [Aeromonas simiae]MDO2948503.1 GGDEF domain-containing protein [Aeromonas simiae]MDO2955886.1 GGDEF domain-containing protein [Aeromonas simiae]
MLRRQDLLLGAIVTLFLASSITSLWLERRHEQLVDNVYRNAQWNVTQMLLRSQRLLFELRLFKQGVLSFEAVARSYDILWNQLDVFLVGKETADMRQRYGMGERLQALFVEIKELEPMMESAARLQQPALAVHLARLQPLVEEVNRVGSRILSSHEQERSVSDIRENLRWLQWCQFILLLAGSLLVLALIRANIGNRRLARLDPLTRLGNRRALHERLAEHGGEPCALVVLDLKRFKQVNDLMGYQVGDRLLCQVAGMLAQRYGEHAFRLGGDEFAVLLVQASPPLLEAQCEQLGQLISFDFACREGVFRVECRLGIAFLHRDHATLLDEAILALNRAKLGDLGERVHYHPALHEELRTLLDEGSGPDRVH